MLRRLRGRMTYANTMATLALFTALGGSSYAAFNLPKNSVGTKQLKNNAVTSSKIKNGAVTAKKLNVKGVTVPHAVQANNALTAGRANFANTATKATNATNADHATNADNIPGLTYKPITLINGWSAVTGYRPPEYAVDAQGVVHFEGVMRRTTGGSVNPFDMPASLAPGGAALSSIRLAVVEVGGTTGALDITPAGTVTVLDDPEHVGSGAGATFLEGVTYLPGG